MVILEVEINCTRLKAARHIFHKFKKEGFEPKYSTSNYVTADIASIDCYKKYYGSVIFLLSLSADFSSHVCRSAMADASHGQGIGLLSYGTLFHMFVHDTSNHIVPFVFFQSGETESKDPWGHVFTELKGVKGFDLEKWNIIGDQEKPIDCSYCSSFEYASILLDMLHIRKSMLQAIGLDCSVGLYDYITLQRVGVWTKKLLNNNIKGAEPQQMLHQFVKYQGKQFYATIKMPCLAPLLYLHM